MSDLSKGNLLLNTLTFEALQGLHPHELNAEIGTILVTADETPEYVFFPHCGAVLSIVRSTQDGFMVESGVIGNEGLVHLQAVLAAPAPMGNQAVVQMDGRFTRIRVHRLREHFRVEEAFRESVLRFTASFIEQLSQNLVCNRVHPIEQRLAKWLLIIRDRMETDVLHLTQDFLAHMLGVHRPGVSIAMSSMELDGVILHARNLITIGDLAGLEARSCECYPVIRDALSGLRTVLEPLSVRDHTDTPSRVA